MLCRTSATCQRDDEYEPLANPEQLRVRGRLRQVARDRGAAALCGVLAGVGERLRRSACSWAARRCTVCSAHSAPPSQLSTSMRTTASGCTTGALKAVLEALRMSMVPPSMLAEIDKCLRVARGPRWRSSPPSVAQGKVLRALAVGAVCRRARLHPQRDDHGAARRRSDSGHTTGDGEDSMRALDEAPFRVGQASAASVSKASARACSSATSSRTASGSRFSTSGGSRAARRTWRRSAAWPTAPSPIRRC
jgi:hypothetical protein